MKRIERISLIGLGAIGAAYASRIYDMDEGCVQIILGNDRIARYGNHPITVGRRGYSFHYISPDVITEPADLVIISVKYDGLASALKDIKNHVGPDTIILPLLNGISSEDIVAEVYGRKHVLYAMCVGIDAVRIDRDVQFSSIGRICFGEATNDELSEDVRMVKVLFERANIPYEVPQDMLRMMWWKFAINVGVNQSSAVLKAPYGVFHEVEEARAVMIGAMKEVVLLSEKVDVNLTDEDIDEIIRVIGKLSPDGKTSMLQDMEAGRKTEVEYLAGKVCELGLTYHIPTPVNDMLYKMIRSLERMNELGREAQEKGIRQ